MLFAVIVGACALYAVLLAGVYTASIGAYVAFALAIAALAAVALVGDRLRELPWFRIYVVVQIVSIPAMVAVGYAFQGNVGTDYQELADIATAVVLGQDMPHVDKYGAYPNNHLLLMFMILLFEAVHAVSPGAGQAEFMFCHVLVNIALIQVSFALVASAVRMLWGKRRAGVAGLLMVTCSPIWLNCTNPYSDTGSLCAIALVAWLVAAFLKNSISHGDAASSADSATGAETSVGGCIKRSVKAPVAVSVTGQVTSVGTPLRASVPARSADALRGVPTGVTAPVNNPNVHTPTGGRAEARSERYGQTRIIHHVRAKAIELADSGRWRTVAALVGIGLACGIGFKLKATVAVLAVAFCLVALAMMRPRRALSCVAVVALSAVVAVSGCNAFIEAVRPDSLPYGTEERDRWAFPYVHWTMMSMNPKGDGTYYPKDYDFTSSFESYDEKQAACTERLLKRLDKLGPDGVAYRILVQKPADLLRSGAFVKNETPSRWIGEETPVGRAFSVYLNYAQGYHLAMLLLMALCAFGTGRAIWRGRVKVRPDSSMRVRCTTNDFISRGDAPQRIRPSRDNGRPDGRPYVRKRIIRRFRGDAPQGVCSGGDGGCAEARSERYGREERARLFMVLFCMMSLFGFMLFICGFWEAKARYPVHFLPLFIILETCGIAQLCTLGQDVRARRRREEARQGEGEQS